MQRFDELPDPLREVRSRPLFVVRLEVPRVLVVGATGAGLRRVGVVSGGSFEGARLSGEVLDGGSDWQTVRPDGSVALDARLVLKADDGTLIAMTYQGVRHGPREILERIDRGEIVDPGAYYFRINPLFETASPRYDWLNRVVAVGAGHRFPEGPVYSVFEVL